MISVIIPTYQRYEMLKEAVNSVLSQSYQNVEIIVVDDCSNDETHKIAELSPKITYLCNETNCGPGYSRKRGLLCSKGEYIVFLDDDDYYISESFFSDASTKLASNKDYVFVAAYAKELDQLSGARKLDSLNIYGEMDAIDYLRGFSFQYNVPLTFATMFNRKHLESCGVFQMEMVNHMPMIMRCLQFGKVYFIDNYVGIYRKHTDNISNKITTQFLIDNLVEKHEIYKLIKKANLFDNYNEWWLEQIKTTVGYYVYGSHPSFCKLKSVEKWCINNSELSNDITALFENYYTYLIDYQVCALKRKIKKVLGMK